MGELVDDAQHAELASIMGAVLDEVVGPDVVGSLGPQADARAVVQPQAAAFGLFGGDLQPLPSPDPLHPLVVHRPAGMAQQGRDPPIAVAAVAWPARRCRRSTPLVIARPRGPCAASNDADRAPRRPAARRPCSSLGLARCRPGDARGLEVSPGGLGQDQLVQRQVRHRSTQPRFSSSSFSRFT